MRVEAGKALRNAIGGPDTTICRDTLDRLAIRENEQNVDFSHGFEVHGSRDDLAYFQG